MIRSFGDAETEKIFNQEFSKQFRAVQATALRKLLYLQHARSLADLARMPGHRLEKLEGDRKGQYSIRINDQYRICFTWKGEDAHHVEIVDYH